MNRWFVIVLATTVVPFAILPWITIAREQPQPWYFSHALFHIVYLPIIAVAAFAGFQLARTAAQGGVRVLAYLLVAAQTAAFAGHAGELVSVTRNGGFDAGEEIFEEWLHSLSETFALPGLLAGLALVVAITVVLAVDRRRQGAAAAPRPA